MPGVVAVLTAADLPIVGADSMRMYEPLARDEAMFAGQPVALVIAETETAAADAVELVIGGGGAAARWSSDLDAAMRPTARWRGSCRCARTTMPRAARRRPPTRPWVARARSSWTRSSRPTSSTATLREGDAARALAASDVVTVEGTFRTNWVYQAYLEPHAATAWTEPDGTLSVVAATQGIFYVRKQLAKIYGRPISKVRVQATPLGGSFGSKILIVEPLVAGAALVLGRPVRLVLNRREDMAATNPAPASLIEVRIGATRRRDADRARRPARRSMPAAYTEWSIEGIAAILVAGPYRWQAFDVRAYGVQTNRFGTGSYRGPGGPQAAFAIESLMDELAAKLGIDPIELRLRNLVDRGGPHGRR